MTDQVTERPIAVTAIAWLLIAAGIVSFAVHVSHVLWHRAVHFEQLLIPFIPLLAIVAGIFVLKGHNWARWLGLAWMAFHMAISLSALGEATVHSVLFVLIAYAFFNREARIYFQQQAS